MSEFENKIVAFDGLSGTGKTILISMLEERSLNAVVIEENKIDPLREATAAFNKLLKEFSPGGAAEKVMQRYPYACGDLDEAWLYAEQFDKGARGQAMLAYMFAAGRRFVDPLVRQARGTRDVILDRWMVSGWAYQVSPEADYNWQQIRDLHIGMGFVLPDVQFVISSTPKQMALRKRFRRELGGGTSGQMSCGREDLIQATYLDIHNSLKGEMPIYLIENKGRILPAYQKVEQIVASHGFKLKPDSV
jgi:thymidylate kinase